MKIVGRIFMLAALISTFAVPSCFAMSVLKNEEALQYLKDAKAHLLAGNYSYKILSRNHRDAMHGRFSDGLIFSPGAGKFLFLRKKDGDCAVVVGSPKGTDGAPVDDAAWQKKIQNTLSDDNPLPYVFLDDNKQELAVAFIGKGTQIASKINSENLLELTILVEGARDMQRSVRRRR